MAIALHSEALLLAEAENLLTEANLPWEHVWGLDKDSILYENKQHRARTAWINCHASTGKLSVKMVEGFQIKRPG